MHAAANINNRSISYILFSPKLFYTYNDFFFSLINSRHTMLNYVSASIIYTEHGLLFKEVSVSKMWLHGLCIKLTEQQIKLFFYYINKSILMHQKTSIIAYASNITLLTCFHGRALLTL